MKQFATVFVAGILALNAATAQAQTPFRYPQHVAFLINGQMVRTIPVTAAQLDGSPGIHVGVGSEVVVAAFTVESTQSPVAQVGGK